MRHRFLRRLRSATADLHVADRAAAGWQINPGFLPYEGPAGLRGSAAVAGDGASAPRVVLTRLRREVMRDPVTTARHFSSTSAGTRSAPAAPAATAADACAADVAPSAVLVKVGGGKWSPVAHTELLGMNRSDVLKALKADEVFGPDLTDVKLSGCAVTVFKLPANQKVPSAEDERSATKFVEVEGAETVSATAGSIAAGEQLCICVQLPSESSATGGGSAPSPLAEWHGLLASQLSTDDVYASAASVAASAVRDSSLTVDAEAALWNAPATSDILQKPLPFDTSNKDKQVVMLELVDPVHASTAAPALHERVWKMLQPAFNNSTAQRSSVVLLTGVSGAGKTKVAFDIGSKYAFVVMARVHEQGLLTEPWQLLGAVTEKLQAQSMRRRGSAAHGLPAAAESQSAVGALLLLLSCHLEWAVAVHGAAVHADPALATDEEGRRVLRQAVLRAQRNSAGYSAVKALFSARLREVLDDPKNVSDDGCVKVPIEAAKKRLRDLSSQLPTMSVVWCYDEVQVLLTQSAFSNFFHGTFDASAFQDAASGASAPVPRSSTAATLPVPASDAAAAVAADGSAAGPSAADSCGDPSFYALPEDIAACNAELRHNCSRGWFYGLLVAMRHMIHSFAWGHLLCGSSLRLNRELLLAHSPVQGVCESTDADVRLDAATIRAWFEDYLTPAAAAGLDNALIAKLAGRPLYASFFFQQLYGMLDATLPVQEPKAVAATALRRAVAAATDHAEKRVEELWGASFRTASGEQPQTLVAWLYYLQRMGWGTSTAITPPSMSAEVMDAVQRGVLHVGRDAEVVNLADEPITAAAILHVGDRRTSAAATAAEDSVVRALGRRGTGAFGDDSSKGTTVEDIVAWTLLRRGRKGRVSLRSLLAPFLAPQGLFPESLADHTVHFDSGLACDVALGSTAAKRTFLDLLTRPEGPQLLLHRAQTTAAGADLAFLAQRPGATARSRPRQRLVLVQVKNAATSASTADMLRAVDLGQWYPDRSKSVKSADGQKERTAVESRSHAALRRVLAANRDWADPVRVLMSSRPWAVSTQLAAACVNAVMVPAQPVLLTQLSIASVGVNVGQGTAVAELHPPPNSLLWWPTRVRHWPGAHPQEATLSLPPSAAPDVLPSRPVRFTASNVSSRDLQVLAAAKGRINAVISATDGALTVEYVALDDARCRSRRRRRTAGGQLSCVSSLCALASQRVGEMHAGRLTDRRVLRASLHATQNVVGVDGCG